MYLCLDYCSIYSKSFANVLLLSAVDGGAIIIEHPVHCPVSSISRASYSSN